MKYTFNNNGKETTVNIDDEYIKKNKANLGLSTREVILMYLSDEGYIEDETIAELSAKAKQNGVNGANTGIKKKRKAPVRREDPTKRAIIEKVYKYIFEGNLDDANMFNHPVLNTKIVNPERIIAFSINGENYELTLTKKRKPKNPTA